MSILNNLNGLDALKFIMALFVVAIHVHPFINYPFINSVCTPFMSSAVPVFFLISAFLLFRKLHISTNEIQILISFFKRISFLYLFWFVIYMPAVIWKHRYFLDYDIITSMGMLTKDLLLGFTFPGSWFLSALFLSVIVVYLCNRFLNSYVSFAIFFALSIYIKFACNFPDTWHVIFDWLTLNVRKEVELTFLSSLIWVSMGNILARTDLLAKLECRRIVIFCVLTYFLWFITALQIFIYPFAVGLFMLGYCVKLTDRPCFKMMRSMSILFFLSHFTMAGQVEDYFLTLFPKPYFAVIYYLIVLLLCSFFSFAILTIEKNKYFHFVKYSH